MKKYNKNIKINIKIYKTLKRLSEINIDNREKYSIDGYSPIFK
jgi:hypothetical protein